MTRNGGRVDPAKARAAAGGSPRGWYARIEVAQQVYSCCGICGAESATVPRAGEPCLKCRLERRKQAREAGTEKGGGIDGRTMPG